MWMAAYPLELDQEEKSNLEMLLFFLLTTYSFSSYMQKQQSGINMPNGYRLYQ